MATSGGSPWRSLESKDDSRKTDPSHLLIIHQIVNSARAVIIDEIRALLETLRTEEQTKLIKQTIDRITGIETKVEDYAAIVDNNFSAALSMVLAYYHSKSSDARIGVMTRPVIAVSSDNAGKPYEGGPGVVLMTSPYGFTAGMTPSETDRKNTNIDFVYRNPSGDDDGMEVEEDKPVAAKTSNRGRNPKVTPLQI